MRLFNISILLFLLLMSCQQKESGKTIDNQKKLETSYTYFSKKPTKYYFKFDSSKSNVENFDKGYVDTFSIRGTQFKLFSNSDTLGDLELQVLKNELWELNLKVPYGTNGNAANVDINRDGFNDFQNSLLRGSEVFLFDTSQLKFHSKPIFLAFDWAIIDSLQNLYSNNYAIGGINETNLFKLEGFEQTFLYKASINYEISDTKEIATVRLCLVMNNYIRDTLFISEKKYDLLKSEFNYKKYWLNVMNTKGYR